MVFTALGRLYVKRLIPLDPLATWLGMAIEGCGLLWESAADLYRV